MYPRETSEKSMLTSDNGPREPRSLFSPLLPPFVLAPALHRLSRTLSTQLSTFSWTWEKEMRKGEGMGCLGRIWWPTSSFWKMPLERDYPPPFFFPLLRPRPTPRAMPTPGGGERDLERMGHTCAAHSLFSSFLPSFLLSLFRFIHPTAPSPRIVDFAARYWQARQVELSRSSPRNRDLHLSRPSPCTTCRGHLALYSLIATGNSKIACTAPGSY